MEEKRRDKQQHKKNQSNHNHTAKLWNRKKKKGQVPHWTTYLIFNLKYVVLLILIVVFNLSFSLMSTFYYYSEF